MPRTKVTSTSKDAITDDGNVLLSYIDGEQLELQFTAGWFTSLSGVQIRCQVREAVNDASGTRPTQIQTNGVLRNLEIRNANGSAAAGFSYERLRGNNNNYVTVQADSSNSYYIFRNMTLDQAHQYFALGDHFKVLDNLGNLTTQNYTIQQTGAAAQGNNVIYAYNPDSFEMTAGLDVSLGIPIPPTAAAAVYVPTHHQLSETSNQFRLVLPEDLLDYNSNIPHPTDSSTPNVRNWTQMPTPGNPVYGFIGLEIREAVASGEVQQIWRPMRGQVEILYSVLTNDRN